MKIDVNVEASIHEKRLFLGGANLIPMIELVSVMLDSMMMAVVKARVAALSSEAMDSDRRDGA